LYAGHLSPDRTSAGGIGLESGADTGAGTGTGTGTGTCTGTGTGNGTGTGTGTGNGAGTGSATGSGTGTGADTGAGTGAGKDGTFTVQTHSTPTPFPVHDDVAVVRGTQPPDTPPVKATSVTELVHEFPSLNKNSSVAPAFPVWHCT